MADIFHEVDEEVRRERLRKLWDRYGLFVLILAVLFVVAVAGWRGWEYYQNQRAAEFGSQFEAAAALAEGGKFAEAEKDFARIAADGNRGYRVLARLREAEAAIPRDRAAAAKQFEAIAADTTLDERFRDLAAVRAGLLLVDTASLSDMEKRLELVAATGRPYRHSARELLALAAFRAGDKKALQRWSELISGDAESPAQMRARVEALMVLAGIAKG
ncbi:tetratricopeptide repeat protein [Pseudorhodoplanes sp.]|uniref:tetratricopeptide repeat protein n=1 Tax=Pseudorhodoplanes sp. TaxID=1934341 RepID=UPI002CED86F0|nr:tetratricopeptide repeat protein [Pseudorhodoplanes sp.]HWV53025.1 tetratricopeptide repeat protein [Pseudorhodoplanes sp.]